MILKDMDWIYLSLELVFICFLRVLGLGEVRKFF